VPRGERLEEAEDDIKSADKASTLKESMSDVKSADNEHLEGIDGREFLRVLSISLVRKEEY
jgi:hypothetical protein